MDDQGGLGLGQSLTEPPMFPGDEVGGHGVVGVHSQGAQLVSSGGLRPRVLAAYSGLLPFPQGPCHPRLAQDP